MKRLHEIELKIKRLDATQFGGMDQIGFMKLVQDRTELYKEYYKLSVKSKIEYKNQCVTGAYNGNQYTMSFSGKGDTLEGQEIWKEGVNITEEIDECLRQDIESWFIQEYYEESYFSE